MDGYKVKISNVIDIETPSKITVHKFNGFKANGEVDPSSATLDFSTEANTKSIYDYIKKYCYIGDTAYNHEAMKKDIAAFAYSAFCSSSAEVDSTYKDPGKNALHYCWKQAGNSGGIALRKYIYASGMLDSYFYNAIGTDGETDNDEVLASAEKQRVASYARAAEVIDEPVLTKIETTPKVTYQNGKAYIGPLKVTHSGGTPAILINIGESSDNWVKANGWVTKNNDGTFGTLQTGIITGNVFYAVIDEAKVKNLTEVKTKVVLTYEKYKARILLAENRTSNGQNLMFYRGEKTEGKLEVSWSIEQSISLTIKKVDANGKAITTAGIEFKVYNQAGGLVGTLTTTANGKTNTIKVSRNTQYTLKETKNSMYGYKNVSITDATISGGTIHSKNLASGEVVFSLTQDGTINIKNTPELGKITINKTDENGESLEDVRFGIWQSGTGANGYIKLGNVSTIQTDNTGLDITQYSVTYVTNIANATLFKTNSSGKVVINNLEIYCGKQQEYMYWLKEVSNGNYGHNGQHMSAEDITVTGGKQQAGDENHLISDGWIKVTIGRNTVIDIENHKFLGNIEIEKLSEEGTPLEGVNFIVSTHTQINKKIYYAYLKLYDENGKFVETVKGDVIINDDLTAATVEGKTHYKIENKHFKKEVDGSQVDKQYAELTTEEKAQVTKFVTNSEGKVTIYNLEIDSTSTQQYDYAAYEAYNPSYGYGSIENASVKSGKIELTLNQTTQVKLTNTQQLGNLDLKKYDEDYTNIILPDVGFVVEASPSLEKKYAYIALYDKNGNIVQSVREDVTINSMNQANSDEYRLGYYYSDHTFAELTDLEKTNITTFITGDDGILTINNLEVYSPKAGSKYTYKLIETTNSNYGYVVDSVELENVTIEASKTTEKELGNQQEHMKISGYVWYDNPQGKASEYDGVYEESSEDIKLTDLYKTENGQLVKNGEATIPVEIKLRDKTKIGTEYEFVRGEPDEFVTEGESAGKYTFTDIEIANLGNYEVVFVYDGFYYTTIVEKLDQANGSKVKEVATEREDLNNKFNEVKDNAVGETTIEDEETGETRKEAYEVEYIKNGYTSTVSELKFDTRITANTGEAGYDLKDKYSLLKENAITPVEELENINMGIVLREQPKLSINSDIHSAQVSFEGYTYNYKYNGRQNYYESKYDEEIGVKFEEKFAPQRYTRTVFASDVQAAKEQGKDITVSIIYKMQIANESRTLSVMPKTLINYFDARYTIPEGGIGLGLDETNHEITDTLDYTEPEEVQVQYGEETAVYKSTVITFEQKIEASNTANANVTSLYIKFDVNREAIIGLLDGTSTYHNATEILSYASYYGEGTSKDADGNQFITDVSNPGSLYAGIDKMSQPGNAELKLIPYTKSGGEGQLEEGTEVEEGTPILDTTNFEDDTTSAPSLILEARYSRIISGKVWEDTDANLEDNKKLGNGIIDAEEKYISGVKVQLHKVKDDETIEEEVATFSDGTPAMVISGDDGSYSLGYYNKEENKYFGVLPGRYVIKYIYYDKNYQGEEEPSYIVGKEQITVNDYKSTIIKSDLIRSAFDGPNKDERWYLNQESHSCSDARDDIKLRPEYKEENTTKEITYSTYNEVFNLESMYAYTPVMEIGIEFTRENEENWSFEFKGTISDVDFGIIERPDINIEIDKDITSLEIVSQTGASIVPKGDPTNNQAMQYVKKLDDFVSAEIEANLLQSAQLKLEYTIAIKNECQEDYKDKDYYYYGIYREDMPPITPKVLEVVDYLDATMHWDSEKNSDWSKVENIGDLNGLISPEVANELKTGNYHILKTEKLNDIGIGEEKSAILYASKTLAMSDATEEENGVEIIKLTGGRTIKDSIPGTYNPSKKGDLINLENDADEVSLAITPPTGNKVNYAIYVVAIVVTFVILLSGIVIIKKKIIR